ncbi:MAG: metallophosphoesterase family protein [Caldilinea sp.]
MSRVLVISDIHANLAALETVLSDAEGRYDTIWCLGDVVGYGPKPNECVEIIRERAELCVMGNHDWAVLDKPGINVDDFNPQARHAVLWTRHQLREENRRYLDQLPFTPVNPTGAPDILITHASPREPVWEYILTPSVALENFSAFDDMICLVGHTHKPAIYRWHFFESFAEGSEAHDLQGMATVDYLQPPADSSLYLDVSPTHRLILNPGSVGQPRDNDARAAYAILDLDAMTFTHVRVPYPVELTQSQMRAAKLPKRLVDRLSFGW